MKHAPHTNKSSKISRLRAFAKKTGHIFLHDRPFSMHYMAVRNGMDILLLGGLYGIIALPTAAPATITASIVFSSIALPLCIYSIAIGGNRIINTLRTAHHEMATDKVGKSAPKPILSVLAEKPRIKKMLQTRPMRRFLQSRLSQKTSQLFKKNEHHVLGALAVGGAFVIVGLATLNLNSGHAMAELIVASVKVYVASGALSVFLGARGWRAAQQEKKALANAEKNSHLLVPTISDPTMKPSGLQHNLSPDFQPRANDNRNEPAKIPFDSCPKIKQNNGHDL